MALPNSSVAQNYYRAAKQRFDDSQLLLQQKRTTGAVYLAGYTVECFLKALVLHNTPSREQPTLLLQLRRIGHDIESLISLYRSRANSSVPKEITRHLTRLVTWSTDMRYAPGTTKLRDAEDFMGSVIAVSDWADGRMQNVHKVSR